MHKQVSVDCRQLRMKRWALLERACVMIDVDVNHVLDMLKRSPCLLERDRLSIANFGDEISLMSL